MEKLKEQLESARAERDKIYKAVGGKERFTQKWETEELTPVEEALWNKLETLNETIIELAYKVEGSESPEYVQRIMDRQTASEETLILID